MSEGPEIVDFCLVGGREAFLIETFACSPSLQFQYLVM